MRRRARKRQKRESVGEPPAKCRRNCHIPRGKACGRENELKAKWKIQAGKRRTREKKERKEEREEERIANPLFASAIQ